MSKQKNIWQRLTEVIQRPKTVIAEMIGRASFHISQLAYRIRPTVDYTQTDYEWWDKFRRGMQPGYEIGGLFAKPMTEIISAWALGDGFSLETKSESTEEAITELLQDHLQTLIETDEDSLSLGDAYLIVNADGSIQKISPEQIEIERDELDFHNILSITVTTINDAVQIEDKYSPTLRTVTIKRSGETQSQSFPNLIGRIPIVQFSNDRSPNEAFGHPYFEALLTLFADYDDVLRGGVDGVKLMGNPIPVVEGLKDAEGAKRLNATYTNTYTDNQGNTQTEYRTELAPNKIYYFGEGAKFHFAAPGNFAENTNTMLKKLFYVMLQHAKIPEWVWGGAISSSMASVEAQTPAFVKFIEGQRRKLEQPIKELVQIYLATISLFTPNIAIDERLVISWPELMPVDKELSLKWAMWLKESGIITKETALRESDMVEDIDAELEKAEEEAKKEEAKAIRDLQRTEAKAAILGAKNGASSNGNGNGNGTKQAVVVNAQAP